MKRHSAELHLVYLRYRALQVAVVLTAAICITSGAAAYTIDDIQYYIPITGAPASPYAGQTVTVSGTVYVKAGTYNSGTHYIQSDNGGLQFFKTASGLLVGDEVEITGTVSAFSGEIQINQPSVTVLGSPGEPTPIATTPSGILAAAEPYEWVGNFVAVTGQITAKTNNQFRMMNADGGPDTLICFVDYDTQINIDQMDVGDTYLVKSPVANFNGQIWLKPRMQSDLVESPPNFMLRVTDVPDDQGGTLSVSWTKHSSDSESALNPITTYEVERLDTTWSILAAIVATATDSYMVEIPTPDIYTIGYPEPNSTYRVRAQTSNPAIFYLSNQEDAYSVDNLVPPQPDPQLAEYNGLNVITWGIPEIPDFDVACVYRGTTPYFIPQEPIGCTTLTGYPDPFNVMAYYRVQFSDIHGNLSEFSAAVHPISTAVNDGQVPPTLALVPPYPNPFNPQTRIAFSLASAGRASLAVFDLRGRLVRTLLDDSLAAGDHSVEWNGRDGSGQAVSAGTYFCRLTTASGTQTKKMNLVK